MSKKNKKTKKIVVQNQAEEVVARDNDGFIPLRPTTEGAKKLAEIKMRKSKVSAEPPYVPGEIPAEPVKLYDPKPMSEMLDTLENLVKAGKYGKGIEELNSETLGEFINELEARKDDLDAEISKKIYGMARKMLSIAKSYYEYDPKSRNLISDKTYDGLLALYLATGATEPMGIIPKGLKNQQKTDITYPTLHNNVDKAYIIHEYDSIPEGVKETDSVESFLKRVFKELDISPSDKLAIEMSPKIDGVSVNGTVYKQMLANPQTRGDEDASISIKGMNGMQLTNGFEAENTFGIQFEAFVTKEDAAKASEYLGLNQAYVSCRHAAAGIIHRLSTEEDGNLLEFISLYPIASEGLDGIYEERIDYLQNFGIMPKDMPKRKIVKGNLYSLIDEVDEYYKKLIKIRDDLSFAIDGVVITVVKDEYQEVLGRAGRTNKFQLALKFDPATAIATVRGITLDSGSKGFRTIQVVLDHPVYLDGVKYDHVPVLSAGIFEELGLRTGSKVSVHRVGDVIPSISVVDSGYGSKIKLPERCPSCNRLLTIRHKKLYCRNPECTDNLIGLFTHFFEEMGLEGYNDAFSEMLVKKMKCTSLGSVIRLDDRCFEYSGTTSTMTKGFADKLKEAIGKHRDYEVLGALGLPGVGPAKAKILLEQLKNVPHSEIFEEPGPQLRAACVAAVGEEQAESLYGYMIGPVFGYAWHAIEPYIKNVTTDFSKIKRVGHTGGALSKRTLDIIRANGFEVTDGKAFDMLITSSMSRSSGKMDAAKKKNVPIFLEDDFCEQYGQVMTPAV